MSDNTTLASDYPKKEKIGHYVNDMTEICKTLINDINLCNSISDTIVFKPDMFSKHTLAGLTISAYSKYAVLPHYYNDQ